MFKDRDVDPKAPSVPQHRALSQDLELGTVFAAMACGDEFLLQVASTAVLSSLLTPEAIRYRQDILSDCLARPHLIRDLYALAVEAIEREKKVWGSRLSRYPESELRRSIDVLTQFVVLLRRLKQIATEHGPEFHSEGSPCANVT
jgi:hypothetical protein